MIKSSKRLLFLADLQEYKEDNANKLAKIKYYFAIVKCALPPSSVDVLESGIYSCKYNELYGILLYVCYNNKELSP